MRSEATHFISAIWTWWTNWTHIYIKVMMLHYHRPLRVRSRCFASRCRYWWSDFVSFGFISQNFAILSEALAMPNLFRATLWQERVVVRSPFTLCLTTQSTPMPNRRHWDDSRVSVSTLPLMMNDQRSPSWNHELPPKWCFCVRHVHRSSWLRLSTIRSTVI